MSEQVDKIAAVIEREYDAVNGFGGGPFVPESRTLARDIAAALAPDVEQAAQDRAAVEAAQGFAGRRATTARASGRHDEERGWLDLLIVMDRALDDGATT